jgi:uncharacterized protein
LHRGLGLALLALFLAACSADRLYWDNTPQHVRNQLDAADRLLAAGETSAARNLFEQMAETGHPEAMIRAGRAWLDEPGADRARARAHLEAAWARNSSRRDNAGLWLARTIAEDDPNRAIELLETVDARGERFAAGTLAGLLEQHRPGDPRIEALWRRGAEQGDITAMLTVARTYGDREMAARTVRELEARYNAGDRAAAANLAQLYAAGTPLADPTRERRWLERAAPEHDASALALGQMLIDQGQTEAGQRWIFRAADRGHAGSQAAAARLLFDSSDPAQRSRGETYARRAAAQGHEGAKLALGRLLTDGEHSPEATAEGLDFLRLAADSGNVWAQSELGNRLLEGNARIPRDPEVGLAYLARAAENGHSGAMLTYARALLAGQGVATNPGEGAYWLRQAAEAEHQWAQLELGRRLLRGDGMTADPGEGRLWLERAAAQGNGPAGRELAGL